MLDPDHLSAAEALALHPHRRTVERLFFDLQELLNLNRVYAANPNAIAMQAYAAVSMYYAVRMAQAEVAEAANLAPEAISPAKFFPKMPVARHAYALFELWFLQAERLNPWWWLRKPSLDQRRFPDVTLHAILVGPCKEHRKERSFRGAKPAVSWKTSLNPSITYCPIPL